MSCAVAARLVHATQEEIKWHDRMMAEGVFPQVHTCANVSFASKEPERRGAQTVENKPFQLNP
eukprot:6470462-Amphidinium_carterae.1